MAEELRVTMIPGAEKALAHSPEMREWLRLRMQQIAEEMRREAPARSGAGRDSITSDVRADSDGWYGVAGWDEQHYYMGIQQARTHWADRAVNSIRYV